MASSSDAGEAGDDSSLEAVGNLTLSELLQNLYTYLLSDDDATVPQHRAAKIVSAPTSGYSSVWDGLPLKPPPPNTCSATLGANDTLVQEMQHLASVEHDDDDYVVCGWQ